MNRPDRNPQGVSEVAAVHYFNDHLVDRHLSNEERTRVTSDHAQLVMEVRLRSASVRSRSDDSVTLS